MIFFSVSFFQSLRIVPMISNKPKNENPIISASIAQSQEVCDGMESFKSRQSDEHRRGEEGQSSS